MKMFVGYAIKYAISLHKRNVTWPHILIAKRMGETFKRTIPHVTTLSMTRKQIKEKTAYSPASYVTTPCAILLQYTM